MRPKGTDPAPACAARAPLALNDLWFATLLGVSRGTPGGLLLPSLAASSSPVGPTSGLRFAYGLTLLELALDVRDHVGDSLLVSRPRARWQAGQAADVTL